MEGKNKIFSEFTTNKYTIVGYKSEPVDDIFVDLLEFSREGKINNEIYNYTIYLKDENDDIFYGIFEMKKDVKDSKYILYFSNKNIGELCTYYRYIPFRIRKSGESGYHDKLYIYEGNILYNYIKSIIEDKIESDFIKSLIRDGLKDIKKKYSIVSAYCDNLNKYDHRTLRCIFS